MSALDKLDQAAWEAPELRPRRYVKHWFPTLPDGTTAEHYYCGWTPLPSAIPTPVAKAREAVGEVTLEPCGNCLAMAALERSFR